MSEIYIVTEGSYSDYGICGVFSSREYAQNYINSSSGSFDRRIETYVLDVPVEFDRIYQAGVYASTGEIFNETVVFGIRDYYFDETKDHEIIFGFGRNPDAALKSARDNRALYLAEKEGLV